MMRIRREMVFVIILLVTMVVVPLAGATGDELQAAPTNPEFIRYVNGQSHHLQAANSGQQLGLVPSPIYRPEIKDIQMFGSTGGNLYSSYQTTFDLRTTGRVSPVKDQNPFGTCWAFATYGSLESTLMPTTPAPSFSEKNLVNLAGFDYAIPQAAGGQMWMSTAYLTRWNGPVAEATDPYPLGPVNNWTSSGNYPPTKHVQKVVFFPARTNRTDNANLKDALKQWGAVYSSLCWYDAFYNETYTSYYQPASDAGNVSGHAVTIVGWDDTYEATNFTVTADGSGAWIVKNSWGPAWGNAGYFYVSYYDKFFGSTLQSGISRDTAVFLGESTSNYGKVYSYDTLGEVNDYWYGTTKTGAFANVFTANSSETITAIGFYTTDMNVPATISIYKNPTPGPIGGTPAVTFNETLKYMGYNTVIVPSSQQVPVTAGDTFSVVVQVTNPTNEFYIPIEMNKANYTANIVSKAGQGYLRGTEDWIDLKTWIDNSHVCVKAYTRSTTTPPVASFTGTPTVGTAPLTVTFTDSSTNMPTSWNWDFGDGSVVNATVQHPVHTYAMNGTYTVSLTATNSAGSNTSTMTNYITVSSPTVSPSTVGIFRSGTFHLASSNSQGGGMVNSFAFGQDVDVPVTGHWSGSGATTVGIFRSGTFYLASSNSQGGGVLNVFPFGSDGDAPVTGDWTGNGTTTVGIYRGGTFYLASSNSQGGGVLNVFPFGSDGDVPVTGDWTGNGTTTVGIYRGGTFYLASSNSQGGGVLNVFPFGSDGDKPVTGDWNGDGKTEVGIFRSGTFYLASSNTQGGGALTIFSFGTTGDTPVAGTWTV